MKWEILIPAVLTFVTIMVGIVRFSAEQKQANRQPFLQKQLELCFQATEAAGGLASETNPDEWKKHRIVFWRLYWGPLSIVEDHAVEKAMMDFGDVLRTQSAPSDNQPMTVLQGPSYHLAHACRDLVLKSWNVDLPDLRARSD